MNETEQKKEEVSEPEVEAGLMKHDFEIEVEPLKEVAQLTTQFVDEALIRISEDDWCMKIQDPAHVLIMEIDIAKGLFEKYSWHRDLKIGVDMEELFGFLKICSEFKKKWIRGSVITTTNPTRHDLELIVDGNLIRHFSGENINNITDPKIPRLEHPLTTTIRTEDLKFALRQIEQITDHDTFIMEDKCLKMKAKKEGYDDWLRFLLKNSVDCEEEYIRALFSADYMAQIVKHINSEEFELSLATDYPIVMNFTIANGKIPVRVLFAPRIEDEGKYK